MRPGSSNRPTDSIRARLSLANSLSQRILRVSLLPSRLCPDLHPISDSQLNENKDLTFDSEKNVAWISPPPTRGTTSTFRRHRRPDFVAMSRRRNYCFTPNCQNRNEYTSVYSSICLRDGLACSVAGFAFDAQQDRLVFACAVLRFGLHQRGHLVGVHGVDAGVGVGGHEQHGGIVRAGS